MAKEFKYKEEELLFTVSEYVYGGLYIGCMTTDYEEYADISVNLSATHPPLQANEIYVPLHEPAVEKLYKEVFKDAFVAEELGWIKIGTFGHGVKVRLKEEFMDDMVSMKI